MRLRSTDVRPVGFRVDSFGSVSDPSERIPSDFQRGVSRGNRDGMGWDGKGSKKGSADELPPFQIRRAAEFAWAKKNLPEEHTGLVVSALIGMEVAGEERTRNSVMARLESQGRTMAQLEGRA